MQRRLILEVCQGKLKGNKVVLSPGEVLRIGRTDRADFVLPKDKKLSGIHFEISWDGTAAYLRDRNSKEGTLLDGEAVHEAPVPHGSWIRAGQSNFLIYYEAHTPARRIHEDDPAYTPDTPEQQDTRRRALALLRAEADKTRLYAVLDAARNKRILELVRESVEDYRSLYQGIEGDKLDHAAPHLVRLPAGSRLLDALVNEGWGRRWGLYLSSPRPFKEVRRHLRRFLMVKLETTQQRVYFRYYDPWVMDVFWHSATAGQRQDVMAELTALVFESRDGGAPIRVEAGIDIEAGVRTEGGPR